MRRTIMALLVAAGAFLAGCPEQDASKAPASGPTGATPKTEVERPAPATPPAESVNKIYASANVGEVYVVKTGNDSMKHEIIGKDPEKLTVRITNERNGVGCLHDFFTA